MAQREAGRQILLEGDVAAQFEVARVIGDAEAAFAQDGVDLVAADPCPTWQ
jgi:hypothetical protein